MRRSGLCLAALCEEGTMRRAGLHLAVLSCLLAVMSARVDALTTCTQSADCNDDNPCTLDVCDPVDGCVYYPNIGWPCTPANRCYDGGTCNPSGQCQESHLRCINNFCTPFTCDPAVGQCNYTTRDCSDGNACTDDSCTPAFGGGCVHTPTNCNDNNPCTLDSCDTVTGCIHASACDDNNPCTDDTCDPNTGSCSHSSPDCNDNNSCTDDSCNPATGCVHTTNPCDDSDLCTNDSCDPSTGTCQHTAITCPPDNDVCTIDACDPANGACTHIVNSCDDGDACTADSCNYPDGACSHIPRNCADADTCTVDTCDSTLGCVHACTAACIPGEIAHIAIGADRTTLIWDRTTGGETSVYDLVRGRLDQLPVGTGASEVCLVTGARVRFTTDTMVSPPGTGFWYDVRSRHACGNGPYGSQSNGLPRTTTACP